MFEPDRSDALRAAAKKRVELKQAVSDVEVAAASASAEPGWREHLLRRLENLNEALLQHVEEVEAESGLLAELRAAQPRLTRQIARVRDEHPMLCLQAAEIIASVTEDSSVEVVRAELLELLAAIARHRQLGADLVYEGYAVDIGGGS